MKTADHRVTVDILGEEFTIRGDADAEYIASVARLVDSRMKELRSSNKNMNKNRLAVLTALNLADELLQERARKDPSGVENEEVLRRTRQLIMLLDGGLVGDLAKV